MRIAILVTVALALPLAGCGGDSSGDSSATAPASSTPDGARPVSPNVSPSGGQQGIADEFSACAENLGYSVSDGPSIPGGVSVSVAGDAGDTVATFIVFPDGTAAAVGAQRDQQSVEGTGGGLIRKGLTELVAFHSKDLVALKPCQ